MNEISNEILMAYADGELDTVDRQRVEAYLAQDPEGPVRLHAFAQTGRDLGRLFDQPMREPVPVRLLEAVLGPLRRPAPAAMRPTAQKPGLLAALIEMLLPAQTPWAAAAAMSGILVVGGAAGWGFHALHTAQPETGALAQLVDGALVANSNLSRALDTATSGKALNLGTDAATLSVKPVLTFQTAAGGYCRQYEMANGAGQQFSGVGCRSDNGQWRIEIHSPILAAQRSNGGIAPASGQSSPMVEGAIDRMIKGDALGLAAEEALIRKRWRPEP